MPTFNISVPPSVNELYRNVAGVGRVKTSKYKNWRKGELLALAAQLAKPVEPPVSFNIIKPCKSRQDIDGCIKATVDLFVAAGVIPDDSTKYVRAISITLAPVDLMSVTVEHIADMKEAA